MIKIVRNNIELNVVASTLTLITKNTAFSDSFTLDYSQHPFLIIEDANTIEALGSRHILSLQKLKEYEVTVFRDNKVYFGKLKVRSYVTGARKCDLVFGSELIKILDKKISEFMPVWYLTTQIPYSDTVDEPITQQPIIDALAIHEGLSYPDVPFQFPEIYAPDFYDTEDEKGNWQFYQKVLNKRDVDGKLVKNYQAIVDGVEVTENYTSFNPFMFLKSILDYCFSGEYVFNLRGDFYNSSILSRILVLSEKANLSAVAKNRPVGVEVDLDYLDENEADGFLNVGNLENSLMPLGELTVTVFLNLTQIPEDNSDTTEVHGDFFGSRDMRINFGYGDVFSQYHQNHYEIIPRASFGSSLEAVVAWDFVNYTETNPEDLYNLTVSINNAGYNIPQNEYFIVVHKRYDIKNLIIHHPTIDLANHVPDWTVQQLLENIKNLFNVKIDVDDSLKTIALDYVNTYVNSTDIVDLTNENLEVKSYSNNQSDVFKISYANDEFVRIDKTGVNQNEVIESDAVEVNNEFLTIPFENTHHHLQLDDLEDGTVLVLNENGTPNTKYEHDNQHLNLFGDNGIGKKQWKNWVRFRQYASIVELVGKLPKQKIIQIEKTKKIYFRNIVFLVEEITTKEKDGYTEINMKVQSKAF